MSGILKRKYPFILISVMLTPILIFITLLSLGGGHGTSVIFKIFFPYSILMGVIFSDDGPNSRDIVLILGFFLYIYYGIALKYAEKKNMLNKTISVIIIAHVMLFLICYIFLP